MAALRLLALVATSLLLFSSAQADTFSLETLGETIRTALLKAAGVPEEGTPVDINYNKTIGGDDGLGLALNLTGVVHGPNGTTVKETDTTTLGGADNYKNVHDSHSVVSPSELSLGGGKNTNLDSKNSSAGYGLEGTFNKDGTFNVGGGGQVKIKDINAGGGGGINKNAAGGNDTAGSQYYSPYVPPAVPATP